jgi:type VI secretion system protein
MDVGLMPLTLEVVGRKAAQMGGSPRKVFQRGGTIGRLRDNDWVFPDQYISGHHAKISFVDGKYLIEDTSTNGVFVNSPQNRIPRGQAYALQDGDTLYVDDYEVRVSLENDYSSAEPSAAALFPSAGNAPRRSESPLVVDDAAAGAEDTDPMRLLGLEAAPAIRTGPRAAALANGSPLSQHYRPPAAPPPNPMQSSTPESALDTGPENYDPFAADEPPPPLQRAPPAASGPQKQVSKPAPSARPGIQSPPEHANVTSLMPPPSVAQSSGAPRRSNAPVGPNAAAGGRQPAQRWPEPPPASSASPAVQPNMQYPGAPGPQSRGPETDRRGPGAGSRAGDLDFAALLAAAGLESARVSPELSQQFGKIMRVVVSGLMDVLQARGKIKDEFRMRLTTFKQKDNNPLKFSANVEDALHNILVKRNAAYLGPVEAFEDAFQDVRNHQMAMLAGMRVAFDAMLAEFEPERLQKDFDEQIKSKSFLSASAKSRYWELYCNRFRDMVKDADSSFRDLFGDEFSKAYEDQLARLRNLKRGDRQ